VRSTGIVRDNRYLEHRTGVNHVESPQRLETLYRMLDGKRLTARPVTIPPRLASLEEIHMVHTPEYIEKILDTAGRSRLYLDPDTVTSERTCEAAFLAAGGAMEAVRSVMEGRVDNAFAFIRPPGHHAERNRQMGFCIFNNTALAAEYARRTFSLKKIMIVDWDVHHPNGTQHIFEETGDVLLFSTHRYPFFPGTGAVNETGLGTGEGFTVNVPLTPRKGDGDYVRIYQELLAPLALEFRPQLILVSAGFDPHHDDPIGGMRLTERGFAYCADRVLEIAERTCAGRVVVLLEGGYDLTAVRKSARLVLETMCSGLADSVKEGLERSAAVDADVDDIIDSVKETHKPYWRCFNDD